MVSILFGIILAYASESLAGVYISLDRYQQAGASAIDGFVIHILRRV